MIHRVFENKQFISSGRSFVSGSSSQKKTALVNLHMMKRNIIQIANRLWQWYYLVNHVLNAPDVMIAVETRYPLKTPFDCVLIKNLFQNNPAQMSADRRA